MEQASEPVSMVMVMMMASTVSSLAVLMMHEWGASLMASSVAKLATATFSFTLNPSFCSLSVCLGSSQHSLHASSNYGSESADGPPGRSVTGGGSRGITEWGGRDLCNHGLTWSTENVDGYGVDLDGMAIEAKDGKLKGEHRKLRVVLGRNGFQGCPNKVQADRRCLLSIFNSNLGGGKA